jgi:hypothetical protein
MPQTTSHQKRRRGWILATLCLAQLMISLRPTATTWSSRSQRWSIIGSLVVGALARGGRALSGRASEPPNSPATMREIGEPA